MTINPYSSRFQARLTVVVQFREYDLTPSAGSLWAVSVGKEQHKRAVRSVPRCAR